MLESCKTCVCITVLVLFCLSTFLLYDFFYEVVETGELFLDKAPGVVSVMREADTGFLRIKGDDWKSISYGQGFACAQNRLW